MCMRRCLHGNHATSTLLRSALSATTPSTTTTVASSAISPLFVGTTAANNKIKNPTIATAAACSITTAAFGNHFTTTNMMNPTTGLRFSSTSTTPISTTTTEDSSVPVEGDYDVAIVGCGMLGACLALHLTRAGYKVAVIEQKHGPGDGTTSYSTGLVRAFYSTFDVSAIAWEAYKQFAEWKDFLRLSGSASEDLAKMRISPAIIPQINGEDDSFMQRAIPICEKLNIPFDRLDFNQMKEKLSKMNWDCDNVYTPRRIEDDDFDTPDATKKYSHAFYFPEVAYFSDPRQVVIDIVKATHDPANHGTDTLSVHLPINHLDDRAQLIKGGDFVGAPKYFFKSTLVSVSKMIDATGRVAVDGAIIADVNGGNRRKLNARIVVNCSGPWSNKVTPLVYEGSGIKCDNNVTTRPLRIEFAVMKPPTPTSYELTIIDNDLGFYARPEPGGRLLVGGIESVCDPEVYFDDASEAETATTTDIWQLPVYRAALRMPNLDIPTGKSEAGAISSYDVTEDWNPILDRSNISGYYQAIGTSGNCFKTAPVMTKMLSELIIKEDKDIIPKLGEKCHDLVPNQSHLEKINVDVSLGTFSRLRSVDKAVTRNVFA